ncbi:uncharacterized protein A4U43_C10F7510 [Asparagus officinalis]|uniref:Uncharacterized protein n=1 Tax=Asparagus officinalis TaxID=4686 RepID=A0A5P1E179_ASPOF|nr:uncharacterized protein A4U43_C10F7510 [Asparagus officinalis]
MRQRKKMIKARKWKELRMTEQTWALKLRRCESTKKVTEKKNKKKRRKETDEMLKEFVQGAMGKELENNKEAQVLRISIPNSIPRKRSKWKKHVIVVVDDDDKREKEEEKELPIAYVDVRTSVEDL